MSPIRTDQKFSRTNQMIRNNFTPHRMSNYKWFKARKVARYGKRDNVKDLMRPMTAVPSTPIKRVVSPSAFRMASVSPTDSRYAGKVRIKTNS